MTIIAHSFGTWLISRLLSEEPTIRIKRLILCNAVVPASFDWYQLKNVEEVVFVCGNRDIWPCAAELVSSRFSATGTRGAQHPRVIDTYFDVGHGGCLTEQFCETHFLPLVLDGVAIKSRPRAASRAVTLLQYINANRFLIPVGLVLAFLAFWFTPGWLSCSLKSCFVDVVRTEDFRDSTLDGGRFSYVRDITQSYSFNYDVKQIHLEIPLEDCPRKRSDADKDKEKKFENAVELAVYDVLGNPGRRLPVVIVGCLQRYTVSVINRAALVRLRYSSVRAAPEGSGINIPGLTVRNLTLAISPPAGKSVAPSFEQISENVRRSHGRLRGNSRDVLADDSGSDDCVPQMPTEPHEQFTLNCQNIWLLPKGRYLSVRSLAFAHEQDRFLFCFTITGWPTDEQEKGKKCALRAASFQVDREQLIRR